MDFLDFMDKTNVILAAVSAFLGGGWIITFYNAKPKKKALEIENLRSIIEQQGKTIKERAEDSNSYRKEMKECISEMNKKIETLTIKVDAQHKAIYSAYQCKLKASEHDCIVLNTFNNCEECIYEKTIKEQSK